MQINKTIRSNSKEVDTYIESLENHILEFDASNIRGLIESIDDCAGLIAKDIKLITNSEMDEEEIEAGLKVMGANKSKLYERFITLVGKAKDFKAVYDMIKEMRPKVAGEADNTAEAAIEAEKTAKRNISDLAKK